MKRFYILIMICAIGLAFYEQSSANGNKYIMIAAFVLFMFGMMRLSAKTKSKNDNPDEQDI